MKWKIMASQMDGDKKPFLFAETENEFWADAIVESLNTTELDYVFSYEKGE